MKTDTEKNLYNEPNLIEILKDDFSTEIIRRGLYYYNNDQVGEVTKIGDTYTAKVYGQDNNSYDVEINICDNSYAEYECSCPCNFNCKHEYAVLLAIINHEYKEINKAKIKNKRNRYS